MKSEKNIEVEIRSFITKKQYQDLLKYFKGVGRFIDSDEQITYYFDCPQDLRIQQNKKHSKLWLKKGKLHDEQREEVEIICLKTDFKKLENLFLNLGYQVEIKWFRKRHTFDWKHTKVTLDYTKGYGYIIELEQMSSEADKQEVLNNLKGRMQEIGITLTPKETFDRQYQYYKENWKKLLT